jgi:rabenosyn-5
VARRFRGDSLSHLHVGRDVTLPFRLTDPLGSCRRASFGIKTRRHHCRLCGRVVCFLPPTLPPIPSPFEAPPAPDAPPPIPTASRRERCSTFFTYEYAGALVGEKKTTGLIVEIEPVEQDLSLGGVVNDIGQTKEKDERKKVRVCRDCLNTVL